MTQPKGTILAGTSGARLRAPAFALARQLLRALEDRAS